MNYVNNKDATALSFSAEFHICMSYRKTYATLMLKLLTLKVISCFVDIKWRINIKLCGITPPHQPNKSKAKTLS